MSLAEGVSATIAYKAYSSGAITANTEADTATDPGASGAQTLRRVSSTLSLAKNTYQSAEIRSDRQIVDFRHGTKRAEGNIAGELSPASYFDLFEAISRGTRSAIVSLSQVGLTSIAMDNGDSTITFGGGDVPGLGLHVGMTIRTTGNTTAGNDSTNFTIVGMSGTTGRILAVTPAPPADSTASTTFTVSSVGKMITWPSSSFVSRKFGLEVYHEDLDIARLYTECRFGSFRLGLPATGMSTCEFGVLGRGSLNDASGRYFTSPTAPTTTGVCAAVNGALYLGGTKQGVVTAVEMNMDLSPSAAEVVGQNFSAEIFLGRANLTGSLTAFLDSNTLIDDFVNETDLALILNLTTTSAAASPFITLTAPRIKLGSAAVNLTGESGQSVTFNFQALKYVGAAQGVQSTTFQIHDSAVT